MVGIPPAVGHVALHFRGDPLLARDVLLDGDFAVAFVFLGAPDVGHTFLLVLEGVEGFPFVGAALDLVVGQLVVNGLLFGILGCSDLESGGRQGGFSRGGSFGGATGQDSGDRAE